MALRLDDQIHPVYENGCNHVTVVFHFGGQFIHVPQSSYKGGETIVYDYVEVADVSLLYLDELCEVQGIVGYKRYYKKVTGGFVIIQSTKALTEICSNHLSTNRDVHLYVNLDTSLVGNIEIGSSNTTRNRGNVNEGGRARRTDFEQFQANESGFEVSVDENLDAYVNIDEGENEDEDVDMDGDVDEVEDDMLFETYVDHNEEWVGFHEVGIHGVEGEDEREIESDNGSIDITVSDGELESINGSDEEYSREDHTRFNPKKDIYDPELCCGLTFTDFHEFKEAVKNYSIKRGRPVVFNKSDKVRCRAKCKKPMCGWNIYARMMKQSGRVEIRGFEPKHDCTFSYRNNNVKSGWIAKKYVKDFTMEPNPNMWNFRKKVMQDTRCHISRAQAYRAKWKALKNIRGSQDDQYGLVYAYIEEVKRNDIEATMVLQTTSAERIVDGDNIGSEQQLVQRFMRLYCCFSALKKGMLAGCRKIFGIDGCHLKGDHAGMLLSAVGIDPNNNLFPIAFAVTEGENKDSWIWFLDLLRKDLQIERDFEWTIISDKQKGLIQACDAIFPAADHRFCIRHMHANWVVAGFSGSKLKGALYQAATSTTMSTFKQAMTMIERLSPEAARWLDDKPPQQWSRSHFSSSCKCDMLLNNLCESFNSRIRDARQMPILSMFENIRNFFMIRFQENRDRARSKWRGKKICPRIKKILEKNMEQAANCIPYKCEDYKYECHQYDGMQYTVNVLDKVCSCRKWELTGIPCSHACAALSVTMEDPEDYVDECYKVETYKKAYQLAIQPVCGLKQLTLIDHQSLLPPVFRKQPGRPKKVRHKSQGEKELSKIKKDNFKGKQVKKMGRAGLSGTCNCCGKQGHNKRTCPKRISCEAQGIIGTGEEQSGTLYKDYSSILENAIIHEANNDNVRIEQVQKPSKLPVKRNGMASTIDKPRQKKKVTMSASEKLGGRNAAEHNQMGKSKGTTSAIDKRGSIELQGESTINSSTPTTLPQPEASNMQASEVPSKGMTRINNLKDVERGPTGAPLALPYYRKSITTGKMVPNFHYRNGRHYLPRSLLQAAMEKHNIPHDLDDN